MIEVDGSDAGGQLVRSALSLAALSGDPVRIDGVRGGRPEPGLNAQHLAAVDAVASVTDADVEGAKRGSEQLRFDPGPLGGGRLAVDVGTAGSVTLVADAFLPLAAELDEPLHASIGGGTDVKWSPPVDAHRLGKHPLLRRQGWGVALEARRRGFYPEGGGEIVLHLFPSEPEPCSLDDRGEAEAVAVRSVETDDLADADVASRQAQAAARALHEADVEIDSECVETVTGTRSTGSAIVVRAAVEHGVLVGDALGEPGRPAEAVGEAAAESLLGALDGPGAVDRHLGDQLLVPLVVAGGRLWLPERTDHVATSLDLLDAFAVRPSVREHPDGGLLVESDGPLGT